MFQNFRFQMVLVREHASYRSVLRTDLWMSRGNRYKFDVWVVGDSNARSLLGDWDTVFSPNVGHVGVHQTFTLSGSGKVSGSCGQNWFQLGVMPDSWDDRFLTRGVVIIAGANDLLWSNKTRTLNQTPRQMSTSTTCAKGLCAIWTLYSQKRQQTGFCSDCSSVTNTTALWTG